MNQPYGTHPYAGQQYVRPPQHEQHLKLLTIFHYVLGGLLALLSLFSLMYIFMGSMMEGMDGLRHQGYGPVMTEMDRAMFRMFAIMGWIFLVVGETGALLVAIGGRCLAKRRYTPAFVIACIECIFMPFGTVLGIFTLVVLTNEEVKELFRNHGAETGA